MSEHASEEFRAILVESGWTDAQIDDMTAIATAREVRKLKQEGITEATGASEPGKVVGSAAGGGNVDGLTTELKAEMAKPATHQSMMKRRALRKQLEAAEGDVTVAFDRN